MSVHECFDTASRPPRTERVHHAVRLDVKIDVKSVHGSKELADVDDVLIVDRLVVEEDAASRSAPAQEAFV